MKKIFCVWLLAAFLTAGCEMTLGIPRPVESNPSIVTPVKIQPVEGRTPLELLQAEKKKVETVFYPDWGTYVTQIDKVKNEIDLGPDGRYWVLYVNGNPVKEGTDRIRLKATDAVEFRFEKPKGTL